MRLLSVVLLPAALLAQAGNYKGEWQGQVANGDFRISLETAEGQWKASVTFSIAGNEVKTRVTSLQVSPEKIAAEYEFELGGNKLASRIEGKLVEGKIEGVYRTKVVENGTQVDEGSWKAARQ